MQGEDLNSSEEDCQLARRRIKVRPRGADTSADESGPSSLQSSLSSRQHEEDTADGDGQLQQHYYQRQGADDSMKI